MVHPIALVVLGLGVSPELSAPIADSRYLWVTAEASMALSSIAPIYAILNLPPCLRQGNNLKTEDLF